MIKSSNFKRLKNFMVILKKLKFLKPNRMGVLVIILVVVFGGLIVYNIVRDIMIQRYLSHMEAPAFTVSSVKAEYKNWQPVLQSVGDFVAIEGIEVNSQVAGVVQHILFKSGQMVKQGDPLIIIDDSVEQASLKNNQANLVLQQLNFRRQSNLIKTGSTSSSDMDKARADLDSALASVQQTEALIAQKHITAPFDGKLGIRQVSLGEYINPGQTRIVTLQSLNPLYLQFYLPEQNLPTLYVGQPVQFMVDSIKGKTFEGKISAINSKVDVNTHNVLVQAIVKNAEQEGHFLFVPGMFAKVNVVLPEQQKAIVLPLTAVAYTLYGDSVYIIKQKGKDKDKKPILKVYRQFVKTGERKGDQVVILSGIKAGDLVVSAGQMKLQDGTSVVINNSIQLTDVKNIDALGQ